MGLALESAAPLVPYVDLCSYKMEVLQKLKKLRVFVLILVVLFVLSGFITNLVQASTLPLKLVNKRLYRRINAVIVYWYWCRE